MWGAPFITFSVWPCEMKTWVALSWKPESEICCNEWFRINWAPFCTLYFKIKKESPKYCCDCQKQKFNWKLFCEILCLSQCVWKEWPSVLRTDNHQAEADKKVGPIYAAKNRFTVLRTDNHRQKSLSEVGPVYAQGWEGHNCKMTKTLCLCINRKFHLFLEIML